jgi:hypothetical protein
MVILCDGSSNNYYNDDAHVVGVYQGNTHASPVAMKAMVVYNESAGDCGMIKMMMMVTA